MTKGLRVLDERDLGAKEFYIAEVRVECIEFDEGDDALFETKVGDVLLIRTRSRAAADEMRDRVAMLLLEARLVALREVMRLCDTEAAVLSEREKTSGLTAWFSGQLEAYLSIQKEVNSLMTMVPAACPAEGGEPG